MSAVLGGKGYRFIEVNVVKTVLGLALLIPILLVVEAPIQEIFLLSGNISLILFLFIGARLFGSLAIEGIQELIWLPYLKRLFSQMLRKKGYENREELLTFPPHQMWKDNLFEKEKDEIIVITSIILSLMVIWITLNLVASGLSSYLQWNLFSFEKNQTVDITNLELYYNNFASSLDSPRMLILINLLFPVLMIVAAYFLYLAIFRPYVIAKENQRSSRLKGLKEISVIASYPSFVPLLILLGGVVYALINNKWDVEHVSIYLIILSIALVIVVLVIVFYFFFSFPSIKHLWRIKRNERGDITDRDTRIYVGEHKLENDFLSFYSLYYDLLALENKLIKLNTQLYLISAIHSFNLLSSRYLYDAQEEMLLESLKRNPSNNNVTDTLSKPIEPLPYLISARIFDIIIDNVKRGNFEVSLKFFLGPIKETGVRLISAHKSSQLVINVFEQVSNWNLLLLLDMIKALTKRAKERKDEDVIKAIKENIEYELKKVYHKDHNSNVYHFKSHLTSLRYPEQRSDKEKQKLSQLDSGILKTVLLVAKANYKEDEQIEIVIILSNFLHYFL